MGHFLGYINILLIFGIVFIPIFEPIAFNETNRIRSFNFEKCVKT